MSDYILLTWLAVDYAGPVTAFFVLVVLPLLALFGLALLVKRGGWLAFFGVLLLSWAVCDDWLSGGYFQGGFGHLTKLEEKTIIALSVYLIFVSVWNPKIGKGNPSAMQK